MLKRSYKILTGILFGVVMTFPAHAEDVITDISATEVKSVYYVVTDLSEIDSLVGYDVVDVKAAVMRVTKQTWRRSDEYTVPGANSSEFQNALGADNNHVSKNLPEEVGWSF